LLAQLQAERIGGGPAEVGIRQALVELVPFPGIGLVEIEVQFAVDHEVPQERGLDAEAEAPPGQILIGIVFRVERHRIALNAALEGDRLQDGTIRIFIQGHEVP
jgi:hypothetical protein